MNWADKGMTLRKELSERRCFYSMRIHEALRRNGMSAAVVAYELGISRASVSATILGKNHSARVLTRPARRASRKVPLIPAALRRREKEAAA